MQAQSGQDELQKAIDDITNANGATASADQPLPMPDPIDVGTPGQMPPAMGETGATPEIVGSTGVVETQPMGAQPVETQPAEVQGAQPMGAQPVETQPAEVQGAQPMGAQPAEVQSTEAQAVPEMQLPDMNAPVAGSVPEAAPAAAPMAEPVSGAVPETANSDLEKVKAEALRDLSPLMEKIELAPEKKFRIYQEMMRENNDSSVVGPAYEAAKQIAGEQERGEALLSLIEYIDKTE